MQIVLLYSRKKEFTCEADKISIAFPLIETAEKLCDNKYGFKAEILKVMIGN